MTIEQKIAEARKTILNSAPGSAAAKRAGYDLITLRDMQANPAAYFKAA